MINEKLIFLLALIVSVIIVYIQCNVCFGRDYGSWLNACQTYRKDVEKILLEESVSLEYYYLMVAESRCKPNAVSNKGARGFWQLMPYISKNFGCENPDNLECATRSAAKYIKSLEIRFCTFEQVIIAYNMGGHNYQRYGKSGQALGLVYRVKKIRRADE